MGDKQPDPEPLPIQASYIVYQASRSFACRGFNGENTSVLVTLMLDCWYCRLQKLVKERGGGLGKAKQVILNFWGRLETLEHAMVMASLLQHPAPLLDALTNDSRQKLPAYRSLSTDSDCPSAGYWTLTTSTWLHLLGRMWTVFVGFWLSGRISRFIR